VNVVGIEEEGARGRVVDEVVGVVVEEDTRRFGIVGVRERRIVEGGGRKWRSVVAKRMVGIRFLRVNWAGGRYNELMATVEDVEVAKNSRSGL
jgi:hypothetical protein